MIGGFSTGREVEKTGGGKRKHDIILFTPSLPHRRLHARDEFRSEKIKPFSFFSKYRNGKKAERRTVLET